jgi:putative flippase GtrA
MSPSFSLKGPLAAVKDKGPKYAGVSVINVIIGQGLIITFHGILGWNQTLSNALAVCISAVPAYYLSRAWVWGKKGKSHFRKEVLPFWTFVVLGLVLSTSLVAAAGAITGTTDSTDLTTAQKLLPNVVNLAAFGILWVIRFFLMDKLFVQHPDLAEELVGGDFIEAVEGTEKVRATEQAAAERAEAQLAPAPAPAPVRAPQPTPGPRPGSDR